MAGTCRLCAGSARGAASTGKHVGDRGVPVVSPTAPATTRRASPPGQGSDASARQATKALVLANRQLVELNRVLKLLGIAPAVPPRHAGASRPADGGKPAEGPVGSPGALSRLGKNTIVRGVLNSLKK